MSETLHTLMASLDATLGEPYDPQGVEENLTRSALPEKKSISFLSLPLEIKLEIYRYVVLPKSYQSAAGRRFFAQYDKPSPRGSARLSLLQVNRQVRSDAIFILHSECQIVFPLEARYESPCHVKRFLPSWFTAMDGYGTYDKNVSWQSPNGVFNVANFKRYTAHLLPGEKFKYLTSFECGPGFRVIPFSSFPGQGKHLRIHVHLDKRFARVTDFEQVLKKLEQFRFLRGLASVKIIPGGYEIVPRNCPLRTSRVDHVRKRKVEKLTAMLEEYGKGLIRDMMRPKKSQLSPEEEIVRGREEYDRRTNEINRWRNMTWRTFTLR